MLIHPQFDPVAVHLSIRWYGLMYLVGFILFLTLGKLRAKQRSQLGWTARDIDDLLFYGVLGVILGGRLGYVLFYKLDYYLAHPLEILAIWQGGMAFHGGFLGVLVAVLLFARKTKRRWLDVTDFIAPLVPLGLAAGRLGNFINAELPGRVTDVPWAMIFPNIDKLPRHPSQLYQFALEGVALFVILWLFSAKPRQRGAVSAAFLIGYGFFRFIAEFGREPDNFLGLLALGLSMGQWLSLPMILAGVALFVWSRRQPSEEAINVNARPFKILGLQQIAIGGTDKLRLRKLWIDTLGLPLTASYRSERENVDEDIALLGSGAHACEVDLMQPIDAGKKPKVDEPPLNHIGLWVDNLPAAVAWLTAQGMRFAPGGIRKGASGHDICFIHPRGNEAFPLCGEGVLIELVQAPAEVIAASGR